MYNVTNCEQVIGDDIIQLIDELYSVQSNPDLAFQNVSASISGRFLDVDFVVMNTGLRNSEEVKIKIYAGEEMIKELEMEPIDVGYGRFASMKNIWVSQVDVKELKLIIDSNFEEINKENNKIQLDIKKD